MYRFRDLKMCRGLMLCSTFLDVSVELQGVSISLFSYWRRDVAYMKSRTCNVCEGEKREV